MLVSQSNTLKRKKELAKTRNMSLIIGGKCDGGVVLASDWKIVNQDNSVNYDKKIFMVVVADCNCFFR
jgi:hypothetical protein